MSYYSSVDLFEKNKIFINKLHSKSLQEYYCTYIEDKVYIFELSNENIIRLIFNKNNFCHLSGFHYFGYSGEKGWDKLLNNPKPIISYKHNKNFDLLKFRLCNFNKLHKILTNPNIYIYESYLYPQFNYHSKYFAILADNDRMYKLGIGLDQIGLHYPETYIIDRNLQQYNFYIQSKNKLDILNKKYIDKTAFLKEWNELASKAYEEVASTKITEENNIIKVKEGGFMYKNNRKDSNKDIMNQLEDGIKQTLESGKYKAFLKVQSQFHSYSANNAMLIFLQKPDATRVAGYKAWQKLGRQVNKGEKAISIIAPNPYKFNVKVDKIDPKTDKPIKNSVTGEIEKVDVDMKGISFRKVSVFDIKQTDGKELPEICEELQGNSVNANNIIKYLEQISDVPIVIKVIDSGAKGYYSRGENLIAINEGMSLDQTAKTIIHEYVHSQLHNTATAAAIDRATKEVQAESVAYVIANHFGVDTSNYSFDYIANWSSGKELAELKSSFNLIQKTSNEIIEKIEKTFPKELELKNDQSLSVKEKIINQYKEDFPAIKNISVETANFIDNNNYKEGKIVSINELKETYKDHGKSLENDSNQNSMKVFNELQGVVDDLKHASLKAIDNDKKILQIEKVNNIEMVL